MMANQKPHILWDWGSAYDLFTSLNVLHFPEHFGLRASWAAGVRSRLATLDRTVLEEAQELFFSNPFAWVSSLPRPKDAAVVLRELGQIPPAERLSTLAHHADEDSGVFKVLKDVMARRAWDDKDLEQLQSFRHHKDEKMPEQKVLISALNWWSHPEEFGERYLAALQSYVTVFFAEEEQHILPYLQQALSRAQELAEKLNFSDLFIELSQGVLIKYIEEADEVMFVPSYWSTPYVMYDSVVEKHWVVLFGARPADVPLVPGEIVPDAMLRALKALSDPTRLKIMRYLSASPQTPSQLAKRLRLRPPTVIHHLNALRLAGLVYITILDNEEKRYTVRVSEVTDTFEGLQKYLMVKGDS